MYLFQTSIINLSFINFSRLYCKVSSAFNFHMTTSVSERVFSQEIRCGGNWKVAELSLEDEGRQVPACAHVLPNYELGEFVNRMIFFNEQKTVRNIVSFPVLLRIFDRDTDKTNQVSLRAVAILGHVGWWTLDGICETTLLPLTSLNDYRDIVVIIPIIFNTSTIYYNTIYISETWRRELMISCGSSSLMCVTDALFGVEPTFKNQLILPQDPFDGSLDTINYIVWPNNTSCLVLKFENVKIIDWTNSQDMCAANILSCNGRYLYSNTSSLLMKDAELTLRTRQDQPKNYYWKTLLTCPSDETNGRANKIIDL